MQKELVLSFALAVAVVGGALWMLEGPLSQMMKGSPRDTASSPPVQQPPRTLDGADKKVSPRQPEIVQGSVAAQGKINKCILNGKTIYSDEKCPTGAEVKTVELHDSAGVVSPPKAILGELTAQRKAAELAAEREIQKRAIRTAQPSRNECKELDNWIERLDSMARQPQSGQTQDWIKEQRKFARDRQFAIHC